MSLDYSGVRLIVQATAWLSAGLVVSFVLRRQCARAHAALVVSLIGLVVTPLASLAVSQFGLGMLRRSAATTVEAEMGSSSTTPRTSLAVRRERRFPLSDNTPEPRPDLSVAASTLGIGETAAAEELPPTPSIERPQTASLVTIGWVLASTLLTIRLLLAAWQARRLVSRRNAVSDAGLQHSLAAAAARLELRVSPELGRADVRSPIIWCWGARPMLLLPAVPRPLRIGRRAEFGLEASDRSAVDWVGIFCHELAHWKRADHLSGALAQVVTILLPWHPFAWWANRRLHDLSEQACDQWAVAGGRSAIEYAESLVSLQPQRRHRLALAAVSNRRFLVARIERLLKFEPGSPRVGRRWLSAFGAVTLTATAFFAFAQAAPEKPTRNSAEPERTGGPVTGRMTVSGHVKLDDGNPAVGAKVAVIGRAKRSIRGGDFDAAEPLVLGLATVDAQGRFNLDVPRTSSAAFWNVGALAALPGQGIRWRPLDADAQHPQVEITLPKERPVRGRMVDLQGQPAADVAVHVEWIGLGQHVPGESRGIQYWYPPRDLSIWPAPGKTDADGRFVLRGLSHEHGVSVQARDPRFALGIHTLHGDDENQPVEEEPILVLAPSQIVEGTVTCADTGKPAPHARITVYASQNEFGGGTGIHGVADENGRFELNPFAGGYFQVTAYAADGQPYLSFRKTIQWKTGALRQQVDLSLPRGVIVRGTLTEAEGGPAVSDAGVIYAPRSNNKNVTPGIVTGWDYGTVSGSDGTFQVAVPPGEGHLLVGGPGGDYIHLEVGSRTISDGKPGGQRLYPDALIPLNIPAGTDAQDVAATLRRGVTVRGRLTGPDGQTINTAQLICTLNVTPQEFTWRFAQPISGGEFELHGCNPDATLPVMFLDAEHEWGATAKIDPRSAPITIRLQPCGSARVRFLGKDKEPLVRISMMPELVVTPGVHRNDFKAQQHGELAANADLVANMVFTDDEGRVTFPALIPGATYRITAGQGEIKQEFIAQPGKTIELPDIEIDMPQ